ncbi:hypothetical protein HID58_079543, partial [Brassica napus]
MAHRLSRVEKGKWSADPSLPVRRPPVKIPTANNAALIEEHKLTLICRMRLDINLSGEIKQVELHYEHLEKHCFSCNSLSHERYDCPSNRARANLRGNRVEDLGISQERTLQRLEEDRKRKEARRTRRSPPNRSLSKIEAPSNWQRGSNQERYWGDGNNYKRDEASLPTRREHRPSARERLSFSKDSTSANQRGSLPRRGSPPLPKAITRGSRSGTSALAAHSLVSHTPPPNPPREPMEQDQMQLREGSQKSGEGTRERLSLPETRSALERLSTPVERVPLLQDGIANAASDRLQEVNIEYLEDTLPLHRSSGSNIPSSSKAPNMPEVGRFSDAMDRSPIRSLSEDIIHVSLRLGPLNDQDPTGNEEIRASLDLQEVREQVGSLGGKGKNSKPASNLTARPPAAAKKRGARSPAQGVAVKKRRVTKTQSSSKRKLTTTTRQNNVQLEILYSSP